MEIECNKILKIAIRATKCSIYYLPKLCILISQLKFVSVDKVNFFFLVQLLPMPGNKAFERVNRISY